MKNCKAIIHLDIIVSCSDPFSLPLGPSITSCSRGERGIAMALSSAPSFVGGGGGGHGAVAGQDER